MLEQAGRTSLICADVFRDITVLVVKLRSKKSTIEICPTAEIVDNLSNAMSGGHQDLLHQILRIKWRSGEGYAIDITGSQFGSVETVIPWQEYNATQVFKIVETIPDPPARNVCKKTDYSLKALVHRQMSVINRDMSAPDRPANMNEVEFRCDLMLAWQLDGGISLKQLWRLPEETFLVKQKNLIDYVDWIHEDPGFSELHNDAGTVNGRRLKQQIKGKWDLASRAAHCVVWVEAKNSLP